jgi:outer membrane biogenesis lipoprotein LolB
MRCLPASLLALALLAGCSQQASHTEGDGHDHAQTPPKSTNRTQATERQGERSAKDDHSEHDGHGHTNEASK